MKVLITGATGFVGRHVVEELLMRNCDIVATTTNISKAKKFSWFDKVKFFEYSIDNKEDETNLYELFTRPDVVIDLAWQGLPDYNSINHVKNNLLSHYYFIKNLFSNGLKNINITGTCLEYGMKNGILNGDSPAEPANPYAIAKDCLRRLIESILPDKFETFKWIRLFYTYGEGQNSGSLIPLLQKAIDNGDAEFKLSGGKQIRDYMPIAEVAKNIVTISLQKDICGIVNCCSGRPISVRQLVEKYRKDRKSKVVLKFGYYPYTNYEPMEFWGDQTKLNKILKGV